MARRRHNHPEEDSPVPREINEAVEAARRANPFNPPWDQEERDLEDITESLGDLVVTPERPSAFVRGLEWRAPPEGQQQPQTLVINSQDPTQNIINMVITVVANNWVIAIQQLPTSIANFVNSQPQNILSQMETICERFGGGADWREGIIILLLKVLIERRLRQRQGGDVEEKKFEEEKKEVQNSSRLFTRPRPPDEILISALLEINNWSARNDGIEKLVPPILTLEGIARGSQSLSQLGNTVHTALGKLRSEHPEYWIPLSLEAYAAWHEGDIVPLFNFR
ncbi:hypothetical protein [Coxiella burnetii]|uniref:hypothetical protein n=1 Tax=Coxiella burnetii TaxID=777 RepID=UPI000183D04D|nr:hypothetical protein [Coxiella burnetii]ACJ18660.1 hypothetical protein CbuG_1353 [Coxiella burnetii CbuG_Q212]ATN67039.1 hypothetical protein AYM17_06615 [Coxiella burnetii]OYK85930.1 hypothetical protein CbuQ229_06865 [Coxiella burnetii]